jgi:hypothetical protein
MSRRGIRGFGGEESGQVRRSGSVESIAGDTAGTNFGGIARRRTGEEDGMNWMQTSNIEHRTSNAESAGNAGCRSMFSVRCSAFDVFQIFSA